MPLVRSVADQVASRLPRNVDQEDLISAGVFGLLQCIDTFDPDRGTKFESFCRMRIRGSMIDELRSQDLLSRDARDRANRVSDAWQKLSQELGRDPTSYELADAVDLTPREVEELLQRSSHQNMISLDHGALEMSLQADGISVSEDLVDADLEPPEAAHQKDLLILVDQCLSVAERDIVTLRYQDGQTLAQIGRLLGISESRVCQLHGRILGRLYRRLAQEN